MPGKKQRLDQMLVDKGLAPSRDAAKRFILAGEVLVEGQVADKPGRAVPADAAVRLKSPPMPYVGRGGLKLEGALDRLGVEVRPGCRAIDVGASTGGFTDCLLQRGAGEVVAIDVGRAQLHESLRRDPRVRVMERTNARYLTLEELDNVPADLAVIDVSFISLRLILPAVRGLLREAGEVVALVKPQFEAGKAEVASGGIVRDPAVHLDVLRRLADFAEVDGWEVRGACVSPIKGADGNIEFFLHLQKRGQGEARGSLEAQPTTERAGPDLEALVRKAHEDSAGAEKSG